MNLEYVTRNKQGSIMANSTVDQSSDYDVQQSLQEVVFRSDSEEDIADDTLLTSLVRESYLRRLREVVHKNYETCYVNKNTCASSNKTENMKLKLTVKEIEKCVTFLEQKALRACMLATLYQKAMVNLMNVIKRDTKGNKLFDTFKRNEVFSTYSVNKAVETDVVILVDKECQTMELNEINTPMLKISTSEKNNSISSMKISRTSTSLLDLPLPDPKDVLMSLSSSEFMKCASPVASPVKRVGYPREAVAKILPQPRTLVSDNSKSKISSEFSTSNNKIKDEGFARETKRRKLSTDTYMKNFINIVPDKSGDKEVINDMDLFEMLTDNTYDNYVFTNFNNDSNSLEEVSVGPFSIDKNVAPVENMKVDSSKTKDKINNTKLKSLDDRLEELGIFSDRESNNTMPIHNVSPPKGPRRTWAMEMSAQYCNFAKLYLSLGLSVRECVKNRFVGMFGPTEDEQNVAITPDLLALCRKRTANIVVTELTPYFGANRIASRFLFKEFAKRLTDAILRKTYISDSTAINEFVCDYFEDSKIVNSIEDFDF